MVIEDAIWLIYCVGAVVTVANFAAHAVDDEMWIAFLALFIWLVWPIYWPLRWSYLFFRWRLS